jgi:hypothetical protein
MPFFEDAYAIWALCVAFDTANSAGWHCTRRYWRQVS